MRILLDESLPRDLAREIVGHEVATVQQAGWAGFENGELLQHAAGKFDVLVTGDQNLEYQQNPAGLPIPVIILIAVSNRMEALRPLIPELLQVLVSGVTGAEFVRIPRSK
jgi:predicted nuclease of predicted toxin-antitoxin system